MEINVFGGGLLRLQSDERYVLDLCAKILSEEYVWQKRFDTLLGDPGKNNRKAKLPVDAYFAASNIIIEYKEKQHFQPVNIMDRRITISGVNRGEQRKIYDLRKETWARDNVINLISVSYYELEHKGSGKLIRNAGADLEMLKTKLLEAIEQK